MQKNSVLLILRLALQQLPLVMFWIKYEKLQILLLIKMCQPLDRVALCKAQNVISVEINATLGRSVLLENRFVLNATKGTFF